MRAVPIYHLSQSGMRIIKVLKLELRCLVREGQWHHVFCTALHKPCCQCTGNRTGGLGWHKKSYGIVTQSIFVLQCSFFCQKIELLANALLLLDIAPGPPAILAEVHIWMSVLFTCYKTPPHSCNQWSRGVKANFRAHNLFQTFTEMVRVLDRSNKIIKGWWCLFINLTGNNNITAAWEEVSVYCLKGV